MRHGAGLCQGLEQLVLFYALFSHYITYCSVPLLQATRMPGKSDKVHTTSPAERGQAAEPTLFHSFGDFNVPNNNIANFLNNSGLATSNILGRVTGGNSLTSLGRYKPPALETPTSS